VPLLDHGVVNDTTLAESSSDELRGQGTVCQKNP
jgi:hypothetical protein